MRLQSSIHGMIVAWLLWLASTSFTGAAEYSLRFGELVAPANKILVPTRTIKLCEHATGYEYQLEILAQNHGSFDYYFIQTLPGPPAILSPEDKITVTGNGQIIRTEPQRAQGSIAEAFWIDKGDPIGAYRLEVFVNDKLLDTIDYQVVAARRCP